MNLISLTLYESFSFVKYYKWEINPFFLMYKELILLFYLVSCYNFAIMI